MECAVAVESSGPFEIGTAHVMHVAQAAPWPAVSPYAAARTMLSMPSMVTILSRMGASDAREGEMLTGSGPAAAGDQLSWPLMPRPTGRPWGLKTKSTRLGGPAAWASRGAKASSIGNASIAPPAPSRNLRRSTRFMALLSLIAAVGERIARHEGKNGVGDEPVRRSDHVADGLDGAGVLHGVGARHREADELLADARRDGRLGGEGREQVVVGLEGDLVIADGRQDTRGIDGLPARVFVAVLAERAEVLQREAAGIHDRVAGGARGVRGDHLGQV